MEMVSKMTKIVVKEIIEWAEKNNYEFQYFGNKDLVIEGFSSLKNYKDKSFSWINLKNPIDENTLKRITCCVIQKGVTEHPENYFISEKSKEFFFAILKQFFSEKSNAITEWQNTFIGKDVKLGKNVKIGCNCVLDGEITIGDNTVIEHNVTMINKISIGADCIIHSGTVIGKDGFGFFFDKDNIPRKVPHFGGVQIGNRVEIGCNCSIDRGTIDDTFIGDDTKIDSLVLIAHNVNIGKGCLVVGVTDLAGSSTIGDLSYIAPQVCVENKRTVGNNSFVGLGVIVHDDVGDNSIIIRSDSKPMPNKNYRRFL